MTHPKRVENSQLPWKRDGNLIYRLKPDGTNEVCAFFQAQPRGRLIEEYWAKHFIESRNAYSANQKALRVAVETIGDLPCGCIASPSGHSLFDHVCNRCKALKRIREIQEGK